MERRWAFDDLDEQVGLFFEQELTDIRTEVVQKKKKPRNGFELIPQNTDANDWAETVEHRMWDIEGTGSEFISDYTKMPPLVSVNTEKDDWEVKDFGCAYQYSVKEINQAQWQSKNLERRKAMAARLFNEKKANQIMWYGAPQVGLFGMANFPYTPRWFFSIPFDSSQSGQEILAEANAFVSSPFDITGDVQDTPDMALWPTEQFSYMANNPWSSSNDTTILSHFNSENYYVDESRPVRELNGAGPSGQDIAIAYRQDEDLVQHKLVMEHRQMDPLREGMSFVTPCISRSGGIASDFPFEMVIGEFPA